MDKIVNNKKINSEIFVPYFWYQNSSLLLKDLHTGNKSKKEELFTADNGLMVNWRNDVNRKNIHWIGRPNNVIGTVKKILNFS